MIPIDAVELALARFQDPQAHQDQFDASAPLPSGMDRLLALATGSPWLLEEAALDARVTADELRQAVLDLIPQICFADNASYYRTLGLDPEASSQQIKDHYRLLLLLYHPDRAETRDCAERYTVRLNQAYSTLSKPQSRALYDDVLQQSGSLASTVEWQPEGSDLETETYGDRIKIAIRSWAEQLFGHRTEMWWIMPGLVVMVGLVFLGQTSSVSDTEAGVVAQIAQPTQDLANHRPADVPESKLNGSNDMPASVPGSVPETAVVAPPSEALAKVDGEPPVVEQALDSKTIDSTTPLVAAQPTMSGSEPTVAGPAPAPRLTAGVQPLQTVTALSAAVEHPSVDHPPVTRTPVNQPIVASPATEKVTTPVGQLAMQPMHAGGKPADAGPIGPRVASETRQVVEPVQTKVVDPQLEESTERAVTTVLSAHRPKPSGMGTTSPVLGQRPERPASRAVVAGMAPAASARSTASQALPRQSRTTSSVLTTGEVDDLFANYGSAIRSGDLNRVMALFAPDACGPDDRDRDAIRQSYAQLLDSNRIRRLQLSNTHSSLRGDGATAIACSVLWLRNRETGTMNQSIGPIRLDLEKRDGRVLITATDQNWLSPPKPTSELTTQEIEEQVERYAEAFRSGDLNRVMGLIEPMDCCNSEADRQAIRKPYAELFGSYMVRRMQLSDIRWDICGDAAKVETRYEVWLKRRGNGQPSHRTGTIRLDLQRRDGQIVIVNVEHSWQAS